jgi:hypothetical protein
MEMVAYGGMEKATSVVPDPAEAEEMAPDVALESSGLVIGTAPWQETSAAR